MSYCFTSTCSNAGCSPLPPYVDRNVHQTMSMGPTVDIDISAKVWAVTEANSLAVAAWAVAGGVPFTIRPTARFNADLRFETSRQTHQHICQNSRRFAG